MLPQPDQSHVQPGENNAEDNLRPLEIIMPLLDELLGLELPFKKVANQAMICLDKIGNKNRARYAVQVEVEDGFAPLPPNCHQVEAVLTSLTTVACSGTPPPCVTAQTWPELDQWANTTPDQLNVPVRWAADGGGAIDAKQLGARYVDYTFRDGGLYVGQQHSPSELVRLGARVSSHSQLLQPAAPELLYVVYHGRIGDGRGYPLITPEEALACAYYSNYIATYRRYQLREASAQDVQLAEQLKDRHINQARVAPLASGNGLDKILDESKSYNRHFLTDDLRPAA